MKKSVQKQFLVDVLVAVVLYAIMQVLMAVNIIQTYWQGILISVCINVIMTVSLNLVAGYLGELALGHAGFMAVGAYSAAWLSKTLHLIGVVEFPVALLVGGVTAMLLGYIVSIPTLRLRGDYLAIITLAFGEIVRNILTNWKALGGAGGYSSIPKYTSFAYAYVLAVVSILLIKSLMNSRQGRCIESVREDEIAAESSGVDTNKYKKLAFVFSAFIAGVGGALYAHYLGFLQPSVFKLDKSIEILVMVVLGGMGNLKGSIISAAVLTVLPELLRPVADYRMLLYAIVLIVMMLVKNNDQAKGFLQRFAGKEKRHESARS